ncbi:hypothetical protein KKE19_04065 [Patescibacteria group bacterium]|nr:hypothetical protein [Patescibacteria group bacterium]MBU4578675.1 hypothetical protein [Patescibacteria group bacterium]MCG2701809.1 hypothetical protein [Candidatus Parcubacteria bacterium]
MKYKIYLAIILLLVVAGLFLFNYKNNNKKVVVDQIQTTKPEEPTPTKIEPIVFTQEQLNDYYQTTKNPFVLHIRKALNGYLNGTNVGMDSSDLVIEKDEIDGSPTGLSSFDKDYYKSKFVVFMIDDSIAGGKFIRIIFQDKPDKVFIAWVYKLAGGEYDFRGFSQDSTYTEEKMKEVQVLYKTILEDKFHSI